ncbi:MAG: RNA methyltransferase, partial [Nanoarchaeota archaeon]
MNRDIDIVLVEPEIAGNIGAVARVMKNFGFNSLVLVNPKCDPKSSEAVCRAKNAQDVLENLRTVGSIDELSYNHKIGTTGKLGSDYNISRSPTTPSEFAEDIPSGKTGIFFGRESHGLTNEEIVMMDFLLTIPSNPEYPILNLSHAVT